MEKLTKVVLVLIVVAVGYIVMSSESENESEHVKKDITILKKNIDEADISKVKKAASETTRKIDKKIDADILAKEDLDNCLDCEEEVDSETIDSGQIEKTVVSASDIQLDSETIEHSSVDASHSFIDNLFTTEAINSKWAGETENSINAIFTNSDNYTVLSESGLDYTDSECKTTVCNVSFVPTSELDRMGKMQQMLALTSFFDQNQSLSDSEMYTEYAEDGRLLVKLHFKD